MSREFNLPVLDQWASFTVYALTEFEIANTFVRTELTVFYDEPGSVVVTFITYDKYDLDLREHVSECEKAVPELLAKEGLIVTSVEEEASVNVDTDILSFKVEIK